MSWAEPVSAGVGLSDVVPGLALNGSHGGWLGHPEHSGKLQVGSAVVGSHLPHSQNRFVRELCTVVGLSSREPSRTVHLPSFFRYHVMYVVKVRADEEVIRINAEAVVTVVEYVKPVRYTAEVDFPGDPVGSHLLSCRSGLSGLSSLQQPVPSLVFRSSPVPTL